MLDHIKKICLLTLSILLLGIAAPAYGQVKADFTISGKSSGCSPLTVNFRDSSTGSNLTYEWRFGNGNNSIKQHPSAIYITPGSFDVTLIVSDGTNSDSITKTAVVNVYKNPVANFTADTTSGCTPLTVNFTDQTVIGSAGIKSRVWDFGDGVTSMEQNPVHTYTIPGVYKVTLVIEDSNTCRSLISKDKYIKAVAQPNIQITADDSFACGGPFTVNFSTNLTASDYQFFWDFGDNSQSTDPSPQHTYAGKGNYDVRLTVVDSIGCQTTDTVPALIRVGKETLSFSVADSLGCAPFEAQFINTSELALNDTQYVWQWGDGTSDTGRAPSHVYTLPGTYSVRLISLNVPGCLESLQHQNIVTVTQKPKANFAISDSISCLPGMHVQFYDSSTAGKAIFWDFGDNDTSHQQNPVHTYQKYGLFTVKMVTLSPSGCTDTIVKKDLIRLAPLKLAITSSSPGGCAPQQITFDDSLNFPYPIQSYNWDFGNGNTSTDPVPPVQTYNAQGTFTVTLSVETTNGCKQTDTLTIAISSKPEADFEADKRVGCITDMKVKFTNLSARDTGYTYFWDFGDGATSTEEEPNHKYDTKFGFYDVTFVVFNGLCADTLKKERYIEILPPWANILVDRDPCKPDSVTFLSASEGADSVAWHFDDGTLYHDTVVVKKFPVGTSQEVMLVVYNRLTMCYDSAITTISIPTPNKIDFSADVVEGCRPLPVTFAASAKDSLGYQWIWDFGDGKTGKGFRVKHIYRTLGTFDVTLTAISRDSCISSVTKLQYIRTKGPQADLLVIPNGGCAPLSVSLIDQSTSIVPITNRYYVIGTDSVAHTGDTTFYTFNNAPINQEKGVPVRLVIQNSEGCRDTSLQQVYPTNPIPTFAIVPGPDCAALDYRYVPLMNDSLGKGPFTYMWDFGDGKSSTLKTPTHVYTSTGSYQVRLELTDGVGCTRSAAITLEVKNGLPRAGFSVTSSGNTCPPVFVNFTDTSLALSRIVKWEWWFSDGTRSTEQSPTKIFTAPGYFDVALKITDSTGCTDSVYRKQEVFIKGPQGTYSFAPTSGCMPLTVSFMAQSSNASSYAWDMGDGTILQGKDVTYTYTYAANFIPLLILSDSSGCTYTLPPVDTILVRPLPVADFSARDFCFGYPTVFNNLSTSPGGIGSAYWDFGDGSTSSSISPSHTYKQPGTYEVMMVASSKRGCTDTIRKTLNIGGLLAKYDASDSTACLGTTVQFTDRTEADTTIQSWLWIFGDGDSSTAQNPTHLFNKVGDYKVILFVSDVVGCMDSAATFTIRVADTATPQGPFIYRATVEDETTVRLEFSRFPDPYFGHYYIYRQAPGGQFQLVHSSTDINDTIFIDNNLNTLANSYCYKIQADNLCGSRRSTFSRTHCTVELRAAPDTDMVHLVWNQYRGWNNVAHYEVLREVQGQPGQFSFLAQVPGTDSTYTDTVNTCKATFKYRIKAVEDGGYNKVSFSDTAGATPFYVPFVPATEVIRATVVDNQFVLVEWKNVTHKWPLEYYLERSEGGMFTQILTPAPDSVFSYIDSNVNVQSVNYTYRLRLRDSCGDLSEYSNVGRNIVLNADTTRELEPILTWTAYVHWPEGVSYYDIQIKQPDSSFVTVGRTLDGNQLNYVDRITNPNGMSEFCYRVIAHRNTAEDIISTSNEDCVPIGSQLHVPNAFSPNGDSLNNTFNVVGRFIKDYQIRIYDRWGALVFESDDIGRQWDGRFKGADPLMDAYVYIIVAQGLDNKKYYFRGWVTIIL